MRELTIVYGMTETLVTTQTTRDDTLEPRVTTVGPVHPHVEIKLVDLEGHTGAARHAAGDLRAGILQGYWNDPERTRETIDRAGWTHTAISAPWIVTDILSSPAAARTW
jgi:fatty-acyl-CoA synthase